MHFDNFACHMAGMVVDEMVRLRFRHLPHPLYSPDLVICDFYLFDRIKQRLMGVTVVNANNLLNEVMSILTGISEDEKNRAFDHWIERCEWIAAHDWDNC
jgi:hypothetical protein